MLQPTKENPRRDGARSMYVHEDIADSEEGIKVLRKRQEKDADKENGNVTTSNNYNNQQRNKYGNDLVSNETDGNKTITMVASRDVDYTNNLHSESSTNRTGSNSSLRMNSLSKSNPQLNTQSLVDTHPLSTSFMDTNARKGSLTISSLYNGNDSQSTRVAGQSNVQVRYSNVSTDEMNNRAIQRITQQFSPTQIPIIGYEVMEERARFTIYKLRIDDPRTGLSWMVFRRYTDFVRLYQKLRLEHRKLVLPLPEKRLFRNNFDPAFLDDRARGLQTFVNVVMKKLSMDRIVREFFCLDEPPPVGDSEPEAQALFGALEDTVGTLKNQIRQQDETLKYLRQKVFYFEEKMKACSICNPLGAKTSQASPDSSASSNGS